MIEQYADNLMHEPIDFWDCRILFPFNNSWRKFLWNPDFAYASVRGRGWGPHHLTGSKIGL